jgi:hypothetical protein
MSRIENSSINASSNHSTVGGVVHAIGKYTVRLGRNVAAVPGCFRKEVEKFVDKYLMPHIDRIRCSPVHKINETGTNEILAGIEENLYYFKTQKDEDGKESKKRQKVGDDMRPFKRKLGADGSNYEVEICKTFVEDINRGQTEYNFDGTKAIIGWEDKGNAEGKDSGSVTKWLALAKNNEISAKDAGILARLSNQATLGLFLTSEEAPGAMVTIEQDAKAGAVPDEETKQKYNLVTDFTNRRWTYKKVKKGYIVTFEGKGSPTPIPVGRDRIDFTNYGPYKSEVSLKFTLHLKRDEDNNLRPEKLDARWRVWGYVEDNGKKGLLPIVYSPAESFNLNKQ